MKGAGTDDPQCSISANGSQIGKYPVISRSKRNEQADCRAAGPDNSEDYIIANTQPVQSCSTAFVEGQNGHPGGKIPIAGGSLET